MKKVTLLLVTIVILSFTKQQSFNYSKLKFEYDPVTKAVLSIKNTKDSLNSNFILYSDSLQYPWQTKDFGWGLGHCMVNGELVKWKKPSSVKVKGDQMNVVYSTKYFNLNIARNLDAKGNFTENYSFENTTTKEIKITDCAIYTPFNDNYPDSKTCIQSRFHAHIWARGSSAYVFAQRMGAFAPHLGLVLTTGKLRSYEILNRSKDKYAWKDSGSNVRGTIAMNPEDMKLNPKTSGKFSWVLFSADSPDDFYKKAINDYGLVRVKSNKFTIEESENIKADFIAASTLKNVKVYLNNKPIIHNQKNNIISVDVHPDKLGEQTLIMKYGNNKEIKSYFYVVSGVEDLIKKRMNFIVENQQLHDSTDKRNNAYVVYDNEENKIYLNDGKRKSDDTSEGRERLGMGIALAEYLQVNPDAKLQKSLEDYCVFVRTKLQDVDYRTHSNVGGGRHRGYNYAWTIELYLEMYRLTGDKKYVGYMYGTMHKFYNSFKEGFYVIGMPIYDALMTFKELGLKKEYDECLQYVINYADIFVKNSVYYPKSEVNFEQSIVAPSVVYLLEVYELTKNEKYLNEAKKQLAVLEAFSFDQPDYRLNEIAIRHWDGYWFGKHKVWGDTMPHYWSVITGEAFWRYGKVSNKPDYIERAKKIFDNNLCQFFEDGKASCAYVYPDKVNGVKAAFFDPFANDQDFALVYYQQFLKEYPKINK